MKFLATGFLAACLLGLASPAKAGGLVDFSELDRFPSSPCWSNGRIFELYRDKEIGVYFLRVEPRTKRAFLRFRALTVNVFLRPQRYFSSKIVSTSPGVKEVRRNRGDLSFHRPGDATGGWFVGPEAPFDSLFVTFPPAFPEVLDEIEGRKAVPNAKHGIARFISDGLAEADAAAGPVRRVPVLKRKPLSADLLRLASATEFRNESKATEMLFPVRGKARVRAGGKIATLQEDRFFVILPEETVRVEPSGGAPFYAFLLARSTAAVTTSDRDPAWRVGQNRERSSPLRASLNSLRARLRRFAAALAGKAPPPPIPGKGGIQWVPLSGGTYVMGSASGDEAPAHRVTVKPFEMTRSAVTFGQYRACVAAGACAPVAEGCASSGFQGDDQPVVCVDWPQAKAFAQWAGGRLPSEAEWEYAARSGGKDQKYPWGDEEASCEWTVISENSVGGCGRKATWPVCSKPQSDTEQGLCDMAGNVWEWVQDHYHKSYEGAPSDGTAWELPSPSRSQRGGSWIYNAAFARATSRTCDEPRFRANYLGFRLARSR